MTLKINGVDYLPFVKKGGIKIKVRDVHGKNSLTTMDGTTHRGRVTKKVDATVECIPLTFDQAYVALSGIAAEYFDVTITVPEYGRDVDLTMLVQNRPSNIKVIQSDGTEYWDGITFQLKEK